MLKLVVVHVCALLWLTRTLKWKKLIFHVISYTGVFPAVGQVKTLVLVTC